MNSFDFEKSGHLVCRDALPLEKIGQIATAMECDVGEEHTRRGKVFAVRDVFAQHRSLLAMASSGPLLSLARELAGPEARPTKATFLDKRPEANWTLPLHQDLTITVRQQADIPGYIHWSVKAGVPHVQPPIAVLEKIVALRVHLDDCPADNGALEVVPGSHLAGRISPGELHRMHQDGKAVVCPAQVGDVLAMRPLLVHGSSKAVVPRRRRVLHIEYCGVELDSPLQWPEWKDNDSAQRSQGYHAHSLQRQNR
jgi:hypothetical protein